MLNLNLVKIKLIYVNLSKADKILAQQVSDLHRFYCTLSQQIVPAWDILLITSSFTRKKDDMSASAQIHFQDILLLHDFWLRMIWLSHEFLFILTDLPKSNLLSAESLFEKCLFFWLKRRRDMLHVTHCTTGKYLDFLIKAPQLFRFIARLRTRSNLEP